MLEILKVVLDIFKEKRLLKKDTKKLREFELDYEALERMVSRVQSGQVPVEITIKMKGGSEVKIAQKADTNNYKSFSQKYAEAHS